MTIAGLGMALAAGVLSTLSPCVLPLIPIVLGAAASEHRLGPAALAAGLALSFTAIGLFVATIGFSIGLDARYFRVVAAALMILIGIVIAVPLLQQQLAVAGGAVTSRFSDSLASAEGHGLAGQFTIGLLLGAVWSPCAGPTLGAASLLAAQGKNLGQVGATMLVFGIGAALPLLLLGMLSRETMLRVRGNMMRTTGTVKVLFGGLLVLAGVLVASGWDKTLESWLIDISPMWLTDLTVRY